MPVPTPIPGSRPEDLAPDRLFPGLETSIHRLLFTVPEDAPRPSVSAWRGGLGWELQRRHCRRPSGGRECDRCRCRHGCLYWFLFERSAAMPGLDTPPRPYSLSLPPAPADTVLVEVKLHGGAAGLAGPVLEALAEAAEQGLDARGTKLTARLRRIEQVTPGGRRVVLHDRGRRYPAERSSWPLAAFLDADPVPDGPGWDVTVVTPVRLRRGGRYLGRIDWPLAFQGLAVRLSALRVMEGGERLDDDTWAALMALFARPGVTTRSSRWRDWHRRSNRQERLIPMGGVTGTFRAEPPAAVRETWWRWWKTAELFHLGKGTTMGNGRIHLRHHGQRRRA